MPAAALEGECDRERSASDLTAELGDGFTLEDVTVPERVLLAIRLVLELASALELAGVDEDDGDGDRLASVAYRALRRE
jgi:hypothetical protein